MSEKMAQTYGTRYVQNGTILIEDNLDVRVFAQVFLEHAGCALTDVITPKMNGLELADRILGFDSQLPALFVSGDTWTSDRGFGCVAKPFRSAELRQRVTQALNANTHSERTAPAA